MFDPNTQTVLGLYMTKLVLSTVIKSFKNYRIG